MRESNPPFRYTRSYLSIFHRKWTLKNVPYTNLARYDFIYDMASIHKDPRRKSPFWYCSYRVPNGKRAFRSTKQKEREKALQFCRTLEYASHESKAGRLTESRAREFISEIVLHTTGEPLRFYTVEDWLRDWLTSKEVAKSEGTFYKCNIESLLTSLGERAKRNLNLLPDVIFFRRWADRSDARHPPGFSRRWFRRLRRRHISPLLSPKRVFA